MGDHTSYFVGVDIGKTNIRVAFSEGSRQLKHVTKRSYNQARGFDLFDEIIAGVDEGLECLQSERTAVNAVGVAVPSVVDQATGRVISIHAFSFLRDDALAANLADTLQVPVVVDTDSTTATLGELWAGYGRQHAKLAVITWGTGLGAGLILDGEVYKDGNLFAEFGHMIVSDDDQPCICGATGCIHSQVCGPAIERQAKILMLNHPDSLLSKLVHHNINDMTSFILFEAARKEDPIALSLIDRLAVLFGRLCVNLVYTLQPEKIIFVGGLADQFDMIYDTMYKTMTENCWFIFKKLTQCDIVVSKLRDTAGVLGAIRMAQIKYEREKNG